VLHDLNFVCGEEVRVWVQIHWIRMTRMAPSLCEVGVNAHNDLSAARNVSFYAYSVVIIGTHAEVFKFGLLPEKQIGHRLCR
jgi:hypothetical protein